MATQTTKKTETQKMMESLTPAEKRKIQSIIAEQIKQITSVKRKSLKESMPVTAKAEPGDDSIYSKIATYLTTNAKNTENKSTALYLIKKIIADAEAGKLRKDVTKRIVDKYNQVVSA